MVNEQILEGKWDEIKGKLRKKWGQLSDNDLPQRMGNLSQLTGLIQRKTGEGREAIEKYLSEVSDTASSTIGAASEKVRQYSQQAAETMEGARKQAMDQINVGYTEAQRFVREQPGVSLALCFGIGVLTGVLTGMLLSMTRRS